jgi:hypothetical protein
MSVFVGQATSDGTDQTIGFEVRAEGTAETLQGSVVVPIDATASEINDAIRDEAIAVAAAASITVGPGDPKTLLAGAIAL